MKKLILLLSLCSLITTIFASQDETITTFIEQNVKPLSAEQQQFFANFVYFSCATAWTDAYVRNNVNLLLKHAWVARQAALKYDDTSNHFDNLKKIVLNVEDAVKAQQYHLKAWRVCTNMVDQFDENDPLVESIETLRDDIAQAVTNWSLANKESFNEKLGQASKTLRGTSDMFDLIHKTYAGFIKGDSPVSQPDVDDQITKIITCSQVGSSVGEYCHKTFTAITPITDQENSLQAVSAQAFYAYYKELYPLIQELEPAYRTLIFNENGFIPAQDRTENLPEFQF